jgi:Zn-dependent protease with chaperone function
MTWTTYHEPAQARCGYCGQVRPTVEMARLWRSMKDTRDNDDELYRLLCHGPLDTHPTCYERAQHLRSAL